MVTSCFTSIPDSWSLSLKKIYISENNQIRKLNLETAAEISCHRCVALEILTAPKATKIDWVPFSCLANFSSSNLRELSIHGYMQEQIKQLAKNFPNLKVLQVSGNFESVPDSWSLSLKKLTIRN